MLRDLYKQHAQQKEMQERRRQDILQRQRASRHQLQDAQRDMPDILKINSSHMKPTHTQIRTFKEKYESSITLTTSEWLLERPADMSQWILVPCPRGQRCMVVACDRHTEMYNKRGRHCFSFKSILPGSYPTQLGFTVLDCIYNRKMDTFYVLDCISYGRQQLLNCEAQFRFFWLRSKFDEEPLLSERNDKNQKVFQLLKRYDFENGEDVSEALHRFPLWSNNTPELDGFLFYHKEGDYVCGKTPLVCWLFAYMVPDILGMHVSLSYERPVNYSNALQYMAYFNAKMDRKERKRNGKEMPLTEITENDCFDDIGEPPINDQNNCIELDEEDMLPTMG